jgi:tetratricopeptide (TPR) repeat protein
MRAVALITIVLTMFTFGTSLSSRADDWGECKNGWDEAVAACSRLISSGALQGAKLAEVYLQRGEHYELRKQWSRAISDYTRALRLDSTNTDILEKRAKAYYAAKKYDLAIRDYDELISDAPKASNLICERGEILLEKGETNRAIVDFATTLRLDPKSSRAYANRGLAYKKLKDLPRAVADFNAALAIRGDISDTWPIETARNELAKLSPAARAAARDRDECGTSKDACDRAIASSALPRGDLSGVLQSRATMYETQGDLDHAISDLTEAIRIDPKHWMLYQRRENFYKKTGDLKRAKADYVAAHALEFEEQAGHSFYDQRNVRIGAPTANDERACELTPGDEGIAACTRVIASGAVKGTDLAKTYYARGSKYRVRSNYNYDTDHAIVDLTEAIHLDPSFSAALTARGLAFRSAEADYAIDDYNEAIRLNPKDSTAFHERARIYRYYKHDHTQALADFAETIRLEPGLVAAYRERGSLYFFLRNYDGAIADYTEVIRLKPPQSSYLGDLFARAEAYLAKKDLGRAIADYSEVIRFDHAPDSFRALLERAAAYKAEEYWDAAIADYTKYIQQRNPNKDAFIGQGWAHMGSAYDGNGDYSKAIADFNEALRIDPDNPDALNGRGSAYYSSKKYDSALADFNNVIGRGQRGVSYALYGRGNVYYSTANYNLALDDFNAVISQRHEPLASAFVGRGNVYFYTGNIDDAIRDYGQAIAIDPISASAYYHRSLAYERKGDHDAALANYDQSIRLQLRTTISASIPTSAIGSVRGLQFAALSVPDLGELRKCSEQAFSQGRDKLAQDKFLYCTVERAVPPEYRIVEQCFSSNQSDPGAALVCSSGNSNLKHAYDRFREVATCVDKRGTKTLDVANCVGKQVLGENEQYYLSCVTQNTGSYSGMAVCALAKDLTPEQQIALSCVVESGGVVYAYAACVGGQLTARELAKCWDEGIATQEGCFGPNNEIRKFFDGIDSKVKQILGENSEGYKIFHLLKENSLTPGPNHEIVKFLNNGLSDIKHGAGPNNEFVKMGKALGGAIGSVGKALGL